MIIGATILGMAPFLVITADGADHAFLGVIAATLNCIVGAVGVMFAGVSRQLLREATIPFGLLLAALLWATWPDLYASGLFVPPPFSTQPRLAPDLVASESARWIGNMALLTGALALGYRRGILRRATAILCLSAVLNLMLGLMLRQMDSHHVWGIKKGILATRFTGTMLNANAMGIAYSATAVLSLGMLFIAARKNAGRSTQLLEMSLYGGAFAALMSACALTESRTALVAGLLASTVLTMVGLRGILTRQRVWVVAVIAVMLLSLAVSGIAIFRRLARLEGDIAMRTEIWSHFIGLAEKGGPFGFGLGSFAQVNMRYVPDTRMATDIWYVNAAHNIFLQNWIEGGWVAACLGLVALVWILVRTIANRSRGGSTGIIISAQILALGVILAGASVDVALNVPGIQALFVAILGLAWGRSVREKRRQRVSADSLGHTRPLIRAYSGVPLVKIRTWTPRLRDPRARRIASRATAALSSGDKALH